MTGDRADHAATDPATDQESTDRPVGGPVPGAGRRGRTLAVVVLGLLGCAAACWGSSRLAWVTARGGAGVRGSAVATELVPLALLALAALAALFAGGPWLKRAIGVLVAVSGLWLLWRAGIGAAPPAAAPDPGTGVPAGGQPWARGLAGLAGLLELAAAAALLARPALLPAMGSRYTRRPARRPADPDQRMWQELTEGEDPTDGPVTDPTTS